MFSVNLFDVRPTKLLNYLTAPDTVIWSALLASAAVPGILNPVVLMQKTKEGNLVPWNWGSKFKDGSLRSDIPLQALNNYFNGMGDTFSAFLYLMLTLFKSRTLSSRKPIHTFISSSLPPEVPQGNPWLIGKERVIKVRF